ncbi:MAG: hypothetical protein AB1757_04745 [Acidobacteriota bacterium]
MKKRYLTFIFLFLFFASSAEAQDAVNIKQLQGYLDKIGLKYVVHPKNDNTLVVTTRENEAAERLDLYVEIRKDLTVILTVYAKSKGRYFNLSRVADKEKLFQKLLEENYAGFTTFFVDRQGDIGTRFTFTSENGIGYEAFNAAVNEVLRIADQFTPKMETYMQKPEADKSGDKSDKDKAAKDTPKIKN